MNSRERIVGLRRHTGMNRKDFCDCFQIPYRTVTEWERGTRSAPEYVLRLLEYYVQHNCHVTERVTEEWQGK